MFQGDIILILALFTLNIFLPLHVSVYKKRQVPLNLPLKRGKLIKLAIHAADFD
jgi:hypothetical protein